MTRAAPCRRRDERGSALVEFTWLALLLMVPLLYVLLSVFEVQRGSFAVSDGTRAAARAYSLAPSPGAGQERARAAVQQALDDQGVDGLAPDVAISCTPRAACLQPGSSVTVRVSARVALPVTPSVFGSGAPAVRVSSVQTVPYGSYRPGGGAAR